MGHIYGLIIKYGKMKNLEEKQKMIQTRREYLKKDEYSYLFIYRAQEFIAATIKFAKMEEDFYDDLCNHAINQLGKGKWINIRN